jgi:hypothetical protein
MHDRTATSKLMVGELPELKGHARDLRIDACRGIALWWIFLDHVPNNVGGWLTLRHYGFGDAAEIFMFVSGVACALAYGKARRCEGWSAVIRRTLWRSWDIYVAFLLLTLACAILAHLAGGGRLADESNTRILLDHPGATLAHAVILQYSSVNTDVLPIFVLLIGIAAMIATATLLNLISIKPRQQSAIDSTRPSENSRTIMSHSRIGRDFADGRHVFS